MDKLAVPEDAQKQVTALVLERKVLVASGAQHKSTRERSGNALGSAEDNVATLRAAWKQQVRH
jgi:hypothetical protein